MSVKLFNARELFQQTLIDIYESEEIRSLFYIFCEHVLGLSKTDVALQNHLKLTDDQVEILHDTLSRLLKNEPIQYIYGVTQFYNLSFKVTPDVLIPRPETEELIDYIVKNTLNQEIKILDIGTGSGCIAISLAKALPQAHIWAMDISGQALQIARYNAENNKVSVRFLHEDILKINELPENFDIIVSNPPYVREMEKAEMQQNVLAFEPYTALFVPDENALLFYEKITQLALKNLNEGGILYFEINQYLGAETKELIQHSGFEKVELKKDFLGNNRFIFAQRFT